MGTSNNSILQPSTLLLTGIPGLETWHAWISIPFCFLYFLAITGNIAIVIVVEREHSLREPMYLFLSMLAISELGISLSTVPTVLSVLLFDLRAIKIDACLAQMFFIHCFSIMDSGVLLAMAFDRFVAIYNPLRYNLILTGPRIGHLGLVITMRSVLLMAPFPFLLKRLPFCKANMLAHSYCLHPDLIQLPCADTRINSFYGLFVVISTFGLDSFCIVLSYVMILKTILSIASMEERHKALNTCVSHFSAVLIYYVPMISLSMMHRFGKHASPVVHILMANVYLFVPPVLNPIIYSIRTKQIRRGLSRMLSLKRV